MSLVVVFAYVIWPSIPGWFAEDPFPGYPEPERKTEAATFPSNDWCGGEFLFNREVNGVFGESFKNIDFWNGVEVQYEVTCTGPAFTLVPILGDEDGIMD